MKAERRRMAMVLVIAFAALVAVLALLPRGGLKPLTRAEFDEARRRWNALGLANYDIETRVRARDAALYRVVVRHGEVQHAERNGHPLARHHTLSPWTVPGMFDTIAIDLQNTERVAAGKASPETPRLSLRGEFHPEFGYPVRYYRAERVARGTSPEVLWEVLRFEALREDAP